MIYGSKTERFRMLWRTSDSRGRKPFRFAPKRVSMSYFHLGSWVIDNVGARIFQSRAIILEDLQ